MNREKIKKRVQQHAQTLLYKKGYISPVDLFIEMGWLTDEKVKQWRFRKIAYLERVATANLGKLNFALRTLKKFADEHQLKASMTDYKSWGKGAKRRLKFSKTGNPYMEKMYATHYVKRN